MKKDKEIVLTGVLALLSTLLVACGGGGDPSEAPAPPPAPPPQTYAVGGTASGLTGTGLLLQNNAGNDLAVATNGSFTFTAQLANGTAYDVTIKTQPANPAQLCAVTNGTGTVTSANISSVTVTCNTPPSPGPFSVGGAVSGLFGTLVLQDNGGDDLTLQANGKFTFAVALADGTNYSVGVKSQPANQTCSVSHGSGAIAGDNISDVAVNCASGLAVTGTTPADNAGGVARDANIIVQFSAELDPATINRTSITLATHGGPKDVTFTTAGNLVTVIPVTRLALAAKHTLTITTSVRGAQGETLAVAVIRTFRVSDGQWSQPKTVQSTTQLGWNPDIAFDAKGNAIAVWGEADGQNVKLTANRYDAATGWGVANYVAPDGISVRYPRIALDPDGNAVVVWEDAIAADATDILAARYVVGSGWTSDTLMGVGESPSCNPQVAVDAQGNAIAVWEVLLGGIRSVWGKRYAAGSGWEGGIPLGISTGTQTGGDAMGPQIAVDKDGNAMAVWGQKADTRYDAWARRYVAGAGWDAGTTIEDDDVAWASGVQVGFDATGNAIAVWDQATPNFGAASIWSNRYVPGVGWGQRVLVEKIDIAPGTSPRVAVDPAGNAIAVWQHSDLSRAQTDIWSNHYAPGVGWGSEALIESQKKGDANMAHVALDPSGNAIAVWKESDGVRPNIWANRYTAGTGWGIAQLIEKDDGYASEPELAVDADGNAFAIWGQVPDGGSNTVIRVNRFE
ncbi:MAG: Ig-like domain-containing protein [Pseudomonadota bacterium]